MPPLQIVELPPLHLVGMTVNTCLAEQGVPALWRRFKPQISKIVVKTVGFFNLSVYPDHLDFATFTPTTRYDAWAAVATAKDLKIPEGMKALPLEGGTYAKIIYRGAAKDFGPFASQLYGVWIPGAGYAIDNHRPHFEFLREHYHPEDPEAEEEVYVPVRPIG